MRATDYYCRTRALKNAKHVRASAPRALPREEPEAGFGSLIPIEVLAALHRGPPPPRFEASLGKVAFPRLRASPTEPLFQGSLVFAKVVFRTAKGAASVPDADIATAQAFARLAAGPISRYAAQYGPNRVSVFPQVVSHEASVLSGRYNDHTLQGWVNAIAGQSGLPASPCIVVLNPPGVVNADADAGQGVGGYHSLAGVPYAFVNVMGPNLTVADRANLYALALSHEIAEMVVDPRADFANPEVCDGCGPNCQQVWIDYFDANAQYLQTSQTFPPPIAYGFFINAIVRPDAASACPAPGSACNYAPP